VVDEVLDPARLGEYESSTSAESVLVEALGRGRTGRMGQIVATIAAEQDRIIRSPGNGALVVAGGPGTGKTVVALHRAAFLLYQQRGRLEQSGVLVVGPSPTFLTYISEVLPGLGETAVVLCSPGELYPGVTAVVRDAGPTARVKGDARMARVLAAAVAARHEMPVDGIELTLVDGAVRVPHDELARCRRLALGEATTHNAGRETFLVAALDAAARAVARKRFIDENDAWVRADIVEELREQPQVRRVLNLLWMPLAPERVLARLYADERWRRDVVGRLLDDDERAALGRDDGTAWTVDDVPLLDELAELCGEDRTGTAALAAAAARAEQARAAAAEQVLAAKLMVELTGEEVFDEALDEAEDLTGYLGMVDSAALAERWAETRARGTLAEQALADREWVYGHVVVDEAQELSAMAWRMIGRRTPAGSLTVVGDLAQTESEAGGGDWVAALARIAHGQVQVEALTVNYRTPAALMAPSLGVLAAQGRRGTSPVSVLEGDETPTDEPTTQAALPGLVAARAGEWVALGWRVGVVAPPAWRLAVLAACRAAGLDIGVGPDAVSHRAALLSPWEAKGCEFDGVVVVEPAALAEGPSGLGALYVALTRAGRAMALVRTRPLPAAIEPTTLRRP
jgi:DNA helicase IV